MSNRPTETSLSRREFLRIATLSTAALTSGCMRQINRYSSKKKRLNIIFLLTDDQRARTLSVSDHPVIKTPNLDQLASNGVRFSNAFVTDPTCMPSRVTFLTGLYERVHGVGFSSEHVLTQKQWSYTYPALLRANGYYTGFIGKFGVERYPFRGSPLKEFDFWRGHDGWASFFSPIDLPRKEQNLGHLHVHDQKDALDPSVQRRNTDSELRACE